MMISTMDEEGISQPEVEPDLDQRAKKDDLNSKVSMIKWILI